MSIYKSEKGKSEILNLYDKQLSRLKIAYRDKWISTSFGQTHLVETGNFDGIPLLVFHGGNATTAYNLLTCDFLFKDFHIYAVDSIGHPGKSAEVSLSHINYDYGKWVSDVIDCLGFLKIACFGGSFGAGIIAKAMCVVPEKIDIAVLYVPSGIKNAPSIKNASMMLPMIMYWITHKDKWLKKCMLPMAVKEENITDDIYETAKLSINYSKIKSGMPSNISKKLIKNYVAPTLVLAAEKDCLFPGKGVLQQSKKIFRNVKTYLLKERGHMSFITDSEKLMICDFLKGGNHEKNI
ncbi:MAG: alpha/beta hydrolase [Treponema sp.]|nr:alpha/beta hydrolase [Treponema sp.]